MKYKIYYIFFCCLWLGILVTLFVSLIGCNDTFVEEPETIKIEHANLDSLSNMADSAVNDVHHTIIDLDNDVKTKDKKIKRQIRELKAMQVLYEQKKAEALIEIERARIEKAEVDSAMVVLEKEFFQKWDDYEKELLLLEKDIDLIVEQLNTAVEEITIVVLQFGQQHMLYDQNTKICELIGYLPPGKLDSLINNTPIIYKIKRR